MRRDIGTIIHTFDFLFLLTSYIYNNSFRVNNLFLSQFRQIGRELAHEPA